MPTLTCSRSRNTWNASATTGPRSTVESRLMIDAKVEIGVTAYKRRA
jgi:hypothetical protein